MAEIAKRTLLKIKRNSEIYDLFVKSNARNVDCFDAEGNKVTLYKIQSLSIGFLGDEKGTENCIIISNTIGMHENATVTIEGN